MDSNLNLRNELVRDAASMCHKLGKAPDAVVISGDIAFAGDAAEYLYATSWIESLCKQCSARMDSAFVIPGNHDVVRQHAKRLLVQAVHRDIKNASALSLQNLLRGQLSDEEAGKLLYQSIQPYNLFAGQFFCDLLPPERTIAKRDLILNDGSILRLAGLNSTFVSSESDKPGDLFIDPSAFQISREPGVEHVVLCHHPYSWLREGDILRDHLSSVARLHLFGHEHTNRILPARDWVQISASAAHPDRTEPGWEPGYNLIDIEITGSGTARKMRIEVYVRVWQQRPPEFHAKTDKGAPSFVQTIDLDSWERPIATIPVTPQIALTPHSTDADLATFNEEGADPMDSIRDISIRFFKLSMSQKSEIAGKLSLFEDEDVNQPDFERFRRVFLRAQQRGLVERLDTEVKAASTVIR